MKRLLLIFAAAMTLFVGCTKDDTEGVEGDSTLDQTTSVVGSYKAGIKSIELDLPHSERIDQLIPEEGDKLIATLLFTGTDTLVHYRLTTMIENDGDAGDHIKLMVSDREELTSVIHQNYILRKALLFNATKTDYISTVSIGAMVGVDDEGEMKMLSTCSADSDILGSGESEEDAYMITTVDHMFKYIKAELDSGNDCEGVYYQLADDIDFDDSEYMWAPAGEVTQTSFQGFFNGGSGGIDNVNSEDSTNSEIVINNMCIYSGDQDAVGLFFRLGSKAEVYNVTFRDVDIIGHGTVGAVAGQSVGADINNIYVLSGSIMGHEEVGGIVGSASGGNISYCRNSAKVYPFTGDSGYSSFGGIVGFISGDTTVDRCSFHGTLDAGDCYDVGGVVGYISSNANVALSNCYTSGFIRSLRSCGGIIGAAKGATSISLTNCHPGVDVSKFDIDFFNISILNDCIINKSISITAPATTYNEAPYIGGMIGYLEGISDSYTKLEIDNCSVQYSSATGTSGGNLNVITVEGDNALYVGGMIGAVTDTVIKGCSGAKSNSFTNEGGISVSGSNAQFVGGILGYARNTIFIDGLFDNWANIYAPDGTYVGGCIGYYEDGAAYSITEEINIASLENYDGIELGAIVTGKNEVGGVIGCVGKPSGKSTYSNLLLRGETSVKGTRNVGGVVGKLCSVSGIEDYFINDDDTATQTISGGTTCDADEAGVGGYFGSITDDAGFVTLNNEGRVTVSSQGNAGGLVGYYFVKGNNITLAAPQHVVVKGMHNLGGAIGIAKSNSSSAKDISLYGYIDGSVLLTSSSGSNIGGLIGKLFGGTADSYVSLKHCYNKVSVTQNSGVSGAFYVGGVVGYTNLNNDIMYCSNVANIDATSGYSAGGIVGGVDPYASSAGSGNTWCNMTYCFNSGEIKASGANNRGGLIGYINSALTLKGFYNTGDVPSGGDNIAGIIGYCAPYSSGSYRYKIYDGYNAATSNTGFGVVGGSWDLKHNELDINNVVYYDQAASEDLGDRIYYTDEGAKWSLSEMRDAKFDLDAAWINNPGSGTMPYFKDIDYSAAGATYPIL